MKSGFYIKQATKALVRRRDHMHCRYCDRRLTLKTLEYDHVDPTLAPPLKSMAGNVVLACRTCNATKGRARGFYIDPDTRRLMYRVDVVVGHFSSRERLWVFMQLVHRLRA